MSDILPQELWLQLLINMSKYVDKQVSTTGKHSAQVAIWARSTARELKMNDDEVKMVFWAAMLHDIGKIGIPDAILRKKTTLSREDWVLIKMHPTIGSNIVCAIDPFPYIAPTISAHQEKYDGTGYPAGLEGRKIPLSARILGIADAYQAMTEDRTYRQARSHQEAIDELKKVRGSQFDPEILDVFLDIVNSDTVIHPVQ